MADSQGDKYRSHLIGEEEKDTHWRDGSPPSYDAVNKLFEEGRTKVWPPGSLEERVQNLVKTWEMEMFHKTRFSDVKTIAAGIHNYVPSRVCVGGELVELFGIGIFQVDEEMKVEKVEFFFDRGELLGGLMKGDKVSHGGDASAAPSCPFLNRGTTG
ncbi:Pathogen-related protein [Linum perenne]